MTDDTFMDGRNRQSRTTRRAFLAGGIATSAALVAGCQAAPGEETTEPETTPLGDTPPWYGSGPGEFDERPVPGGTSMDEMPDLSGTLQVYSGRGEGLVGQLLSFLESKYPDFEVKPTYNSARQLANTIVTEGQNSPADVFFSVNSGALGFLKDEGRTQPLRDDTVSLVAEEFRDNEGHWTGTSGRARTVPYNTETLSASDVPEDIMAFPDQLSDYDGEIGWAPSYSSFQGFVTAMIQIEGKQATREWLSNMNELTADAYGNEFAVSQAVADGELALGFANHYYIQRVLARRPNAPIDTGFTSGDAGSVFNVAGAARLDSSSSPELADTFVRHLLSSEAQEYFAIRTFEYPLVEGVDPVGRLPPIDELDVPNIDLSSLSDLEETVDLLRDTGVLA